MTNTTNLQLPYLSAEQAMKHITHNEALKALDALVQLSVADRDQTAPPATPEDGERHIVAAMATDDWAGRDGQVAAFQNGAWAYYPPQIGWRAWVADEAVLLAWDGTAWAVAGGSVNPVALVGVNTEADASNRLAAKSDSVLFSHDDVTPGSGDIRHKLNKAGSDNTASMLFQTGWSGRAEFGLCGDDDWHVKVSPDGSAWHEALVVDKDSGAISFPGGIAGRREVLTANRIYFVAASGGSDGNDGLTTGTALATLQEAIYRTEKIDAAGYTVKIKLLAGTHVMGNVVFDTRVLGAAQITIEGDTTTPSNVIIENAGYHLFIMLNGVAVYFTGLTLQRNGALGTGSFFQVTAGCRLTYNKLRFGEAGRYHFEVIGGAAVGDNNASVEVFGGAVAHAFVGTLGSFLTTNETVTLTGTPVFTNAYYYCVQNSIYAAWNPTWVGTISGKEYTLDTGAILGRGAAGAVPGSTTGTTANGGIVV